MTASASPSQIKLKYLHPDYVRPLPTMLDANKSPLAMLAQTCNNIGKDNPSSSKLTEVTHSPIKISPPPMPLGPKPEYFDDKTTSHRAVVSPYNHVAPTSHHSKTSPTTFGAAKPGAYSGILKLADLTSAIPLENERTSNLHRNGPEILPYLNSLIDQGLSIEALAAAQAQLSVLKSNDPLSMYYSALKNHHLSPSPASPPCRDPYCAGCLSQSLKCTQCSKDSLLSSLAAAAHSAHHLQYHHVTSPVGATVAPALSPAAPISSSSLSQNLSPTTRDLPFICNWMSSGTEPCGRRFVSKEDLLQHVQNHTLIDVEKSATISEPSNTSSSLFYPYSSSSTTPALHRLSSASHHRYHPYAGLLASPRHSSYPSADQTTTAALLSSYAAALYGQKLTPPVL